MKKRLSNFIFLFLSILLLNNNINAIELGEESETCDTFITSLASLGTITARNNDIFNSCTISSEEFINDISGNRDTTCYVDAGTTRCSCDPTEDSDCSDDGTCTLIEPNDTTYSHDFITTEADLNTTTTISTDHNFTDLNNGNYIFDTNDQNIHFNPQTSYEDSDIKVMLFGDIRNTGTGQDMYFSEGDYYLKSWNNASPSQINIYVDGDVRIFVDGDVTFDQIDILNFTPDSNLFMYVDGDITFDHNGGGAADLNVFIYTTGTARIESSGNANKLTGGIVAEVELIVTGENINFEYSDTSADEQGFGRCGGTGTAPFVIGFLDAWEIDKSNKDISTKVVNKDFSLTLAHIDLDTDTIKATTAQIKYKLYDFDANKNLTEYKSLDFSTDGTATETFTNINLPASRDVRVSYSFCQDSSNGDLVDYTLCQLPGYDYNDTMVSTDNFAIRPENLEITPVTNELVSGFDYNFTTIANSFNNGGNSIGYNTSNSEYSLDINTTKYMPDNTTINNSLNGNTTISTYLFNDGDGIVSMAFDDIAKVNIKLTDSNWAAVDINDTAQECSSTGAYICGDTNVTFIPSHFELSNVTLHNSDNTSNFIYLSNDLNMSGKISLTITAKNSLNNTTENFDSASWETPVNISFAVDTNNTPSILFNDINETLDLNFTNGDKTIAWNETNNSKNLLFNFTRDINNSVNPFRVQGTDVTLNATSTTAGGSVVNGTSNATQSATFVYGKTNAPRQRFSGYSGDDFIYYEAYCFGTDSNSNICNKTLLPNGVDSNSTDDPRWFVNPNHTTNYGFVGNVTQKYTSKITSTVLSTTAGLTTVNLSLTTSQNLPYKATMQNTPNDWLIHNKYNPNATSNEFEVEFEQTSSSWSGKSDTNSTSITRGASKTNRRTMW